MENVNKWRPTKALFKNGVLVPNLPAIYGGSYHTIKIQLQVYQSILSKYAKGDLIDLGCGRVPYFECYRNNVSKVVCADRVANEFTDTTIDLNSPYPWESASFDTVLLSDVINHIYDFRNLISECSRILRPGGNLIVFTPFLYWISEAPYDFHRFTRFALERNCEEHHLKVAELFSYGSQRDVIVDFIFKRWHSRLSFPVLKAFSDLFFSKHAINYDFQPFPLGYALVATKK
jgi:SAM-dependent methyltransferase